MSRGARQHAQWAPGLLFFHLLFFIYIYGLDLFLGQIFSTCWTTIKVQGGPWTLPQQNSLKAKQPCLFVEQARTPYHSSIPNKVGPPWRTGRRKCTVLSRPCPHIVIPTEPHSEKENEFEGLSLTLIRRKRCTSTPDAVRTGKDKANQQSI